VQQGQEEKSEGKKMDSSDGFERKDVWDVKWAEDNPDDLAVLEKTKMFVYTYDHEKSSADGPAGAMNGDGPNNMTYPAADGDAVQSSGYLGTFKGMEVRTLLLDGIIANADGPDKDAAILDIETRALKATRDVITRSGFEVN